MISFVESRKVSQGERFVRVEVFMKEQGFQNEFDETDGHAIHITALNNGSAVGCIRLFPGSCEGEYILGRLAVIKSFRGTGLGAELVRRAEERIKELGGGRSTLSAQVRIKDFYRKLGYQECGDEYLDEFCPHVKMTRQL